MTLSGSKARAGTAAVTSAGRCAGVGSDGDVMVWGRSTESTRRGCPALIGNAVCSPYRHLVAIFKEDKETFGFEIQVRLK